MKPDETGNLVNGAGYSLLDEVVSELKRAVAYELGERDNTFTIMAQIDLIIFLSEHYKIPPRIRLETCYEWRKKVLELWDAEGSRGGWRDERREVIVETMDKLEALIRRYEKTSDSPPDKAQSPDSE
jgi:hypothetical protein